MQTVPKHYKERKSFVFSPPKGLKKNTFWDIFITAGRAIWKQLSNVLAVVTPG